MNTYAKIHDISSSSQSQLGASSHLLKRDYPAKLLELFYKQSYLINSRVNLLACTSYPFSSVLEALKQPSFFLPTEGLPDKRYLPGSNIMDEVEEIGEESILRFFGSPSGYCASLQPHSTTQANQIIYNAVLRPDSSVLSLSPRDGGHVSHSVLLGKRVSCYHYKIMKDGHLDYDSISDLAKLVKPTLIIVGGSALMRNIDLMKCGEIAKSSGALLHADLSHTAVFLAGGQHSSAFPHCDFITFNTMKNLRGPNGGVIIFKRIHKKIIERSIFPITQGGPNESIMFGKLATFLEWERRNVFDYTNNIIRCAKIFVDQLALQGIPLVSGGTDFHNILINLTEYSVSGAEVEKSLESSGILANKNWIPGDSRSVDESSGLRIGVTNLAILNYSEDDIRFLARKIAGLLNGIRISRSDVCYLTDKYKWEI